MADPSNRMLVALWILSSTLCTCLGCANAEDDIFRFPQDRDTFFREPDFTETDYVHFQKDGSYRRIVRAHMGVLTWDHGTWQQEKSGVVSIRSDDFVKPIRSGPLAISAATTETLATFQPLKNDIPQFLAKDTRQDYPADEIRNAWKYRSPRSDVMISAVDVDEGTKVVTRQQLAGLIAAWSNTAPGDLAEITHVTPVRHNDKVVLVWHENDYTFWFPGREPKSLDEKLQRVRRSLKKEAKSGKPQALVLYTRIDQKRFEKESATTQPFLFYPEMNGRIAP